MPFFVYIIFAQIAVGWWFIQYLLTHERGPKEPRRILIFAGVLGALGAVIAIILEGFFISRKLNPTDPALLHQLSTASLLLNCLLIGVIEELSKALPLTLFIYKKRYFDELTDGIIYYGIAGMVFGVLESIGYTISLGDGAGLGKIITGPFSHASFSAMIGFCVARQKLQKKSIWIVGLGLVAAIGLHALYDFGLFTQTGWGLLGSLAITISINIGIFGLFALAKRIDGRRGVAAIGNNLYCRQCGWPNRKHFLYCVRCGQKT